ncbi:hypothetical protein PAPYR_8618 [Paratrimastix pyriformis]|uniref:Cyclin N-terminal domain-containing protein n=1 Tax=Paratrimastix pyriformis TaxID=342808 RepID=A0ABQ8UCZ3_9EUKA|nr:hypothetical protein PAPYR_8618 [Paratrimastix pyriformis]
MFQTKVALARSVSMIPKGPHPRAPTPTPAEVEEPRAPPLPIADTTASGTVLRLQHSRSEYFSSAQTLPAFPRPAAASSSSTELRPISLRHSHSFLGHATPNLQQSADLLELSMSTTIPPGHVEVLPTMAPNAGMSTAMPPPLLPSLSTQDLSGAAGGSAVRLPISRSLSLSASLQLSGAVPVPCPCASPSGASSCLPVYSSTLAALALAQNMAKNRLPDLTYGIGDAGPPERRAAPPAALDLPAVVHIIHRHSRRRPAHHLKRSRSGSRDLTDSTSAALLLHGRHTSPMPAPPALSDVVLSKPQPAMPTPDGGMVVAAGAAAAMGGLPMAVELAPLVEGLTQHEFVWCVVGGVKRALVEGLTQHEFVCCGVVGGVMAVELAPLVEVSAHSLSFAPHILTLIHILPKQPPTAVAGPPPCLPVINALPKPTTATAHPPAAATTNPLLATTSTTAATAGTSIHPVSSLHSLRSVGSTASDSLLSISHMPPSNDPDDAPVRNGPQNPSHEERELYLTYTDMLLSDMAVPQQLAPGSAEEQEFARDPKMPISQWISTLLTTSNSAEEAVFVALIYLLRVHETNPQLPYTTVNIRRLFFVAMIIAHKKDTKDSQKETSVSLFFFVAMIIAHKSMEDLAHNNKNWSIIANRVFTLSQIRRMEFDFLSILHWDVLVTQEQYRDFLRFLQGTLHTMLVKGNPIATAAARRHGTVFGLPSNWETLAAAGGSKLPLPRVPKPLFCFFRKDDPAPVECAVWSVCGVVSVRCGQCAVWSVCGVVSVRCGQCAVWSVCDVVSVRCGQCAVWSVCDVVSVRCGQCAVWSVCGVVSVRCGQCAMWSVCGVVSVRCANVQLPVAGNSPIQPALYGTRKLLSHWMAHALSHCMTHATRPHPQQMASASCQSLVTAPYSQLTPTGGELYDLMVQQQTNVPCAVTTTPLAESPLFGPGPVQLLPSAPGDSACTFANHPLQMMTPGDSPQDDEGASAAGTAAATPTPEVGSRVELQPFGLGSEGMGFGCAAQVSLPAHPTISPKNACPPP